MIETNQHVHVNEIIAWANGAQIQYAENNDHIWRDCITQPAWLPLTKYRVKPKTIKVTTCIDRHGEVSMFINNYVEDVPYSTNSFQLEFEGNKLVSAKVL